MQISSCEEAVEHGVTIAEQATNFRFLLENTIALQPAPLWPKVARKKISALYVQGHKKFVNGIISRPVLPEQAGVTRILHQRFSSSSQSLEWLPELELHGLVTTILTGDWQTRVKQSNAAMRLARISRQSRQD
eukprot:Skav207671  [mRNA]  locus=scaffold1857:255065:255463:- [translate_table: standard]